MDINEALKKMGSDSKYLEKQIKQLQKTLSNDPDKLKQALNSPEASKLISKLAKNDAKKVQSALSNPDLINELIKSPDAIEKVKKMMEE